MKGGKFSGRNMPNREYELRVVMGANKRSEYLVITEKKGEDHAHLHFRGTIGWRMVEDDGGTV